MKTTLRMALFMMVAFALMTSTGWAEKKLKPSGFLSDYSKLVEGVRGRADFSYVNEDVNWKSYDKIMIDHLVFVMSDDAESKVIQPDELQDIADTFHREFIQALEGDFEITHEPGPGVLRFRAAITDLSPTKRGINTVTTIIPVGLAVSAIKRGTKGTHIGAGDVTGEAEVLDSLSNEVFAQAVDYQAGKKYRVDKAMSKWGHVRVAITGWAKMFHNTLLQISGRK
jgi:hypothetical protein